MSAYTFVVTYEAETPSEALKLAAAMHAQLDDSEIVPCGWTPDPDTIVDCTPSGHSGVVFDMNPTPRSKFHV